MTWTPDGKQIIYRNRISDGFSGKLYSVNQEGGMPEIIPLPEGGFCSYSPDGKRLAYNRTMREFRTWKYYKGGIAGSTRELHIIFGKVSNLRRLFCLRIINKDIHGAVTVGKEKYIIADPHGEDILSNIIRYILH